MISHLLNYFLRVIVLMVCSYVQNIDVTQTAYYLITYYYCLIICNIVVFLFNCGIIITASTLAVSDSTWQDDVARLSVYCCMEYGLSTNALLNT